jgi:Peptidase C13 family
MLLQLAYGAALPAPLRAAELATFPSAQSAFAQTPAPNQSASVSLEQVPRVEAAVAQVAPHTPGVADVFFLGFAGYGEQGVFRKEEEFARRVFAERFGSGGRSLALVNDVDDRNTFPLATVTSLHQALDLLGRKMDREEDVLVLMLTSHGNRSAMAVSNGDMKLAQLRPKDLRQALDDAGIRWRVIVISSCFSGTFIKPLRTNTTLIITAADARHSSFGCEDERELTYFGEAFLRDALPTAPSLEAAYQKARDIIHRREAAEGQVHSNPQLFVGSAMRAKLAPLEARD